METYCKECQNCSDCQIARMNRKKLTEEIGRTAFFDTNEPNPPEFSISAFLENNRK
jgi:hypothetical protein